jgi:hypothetical protein
VGTELWGGKGDELTNDGKHRYEAIRFLAKRGLLHEPVVMTNLVWGMLIHMDVPTPTQTCLRGWHLIISIRMLAFSEF